MSHTFSVCDDNVIIIMMSILYIIGACLLPTTDLGLRTNIFFMCNMFPPNVILCGNRSAHILLWVPASLLKGERVLFFSFSGTFGVRNNNNICLKSIHRTGMTIGPTAYDVRSALHSTRTGQKCSAVEEVKGWYFNPLQSLFLYVRFNVLIVIKTASRHSKHMLCCYFYKMLS